MTHLHASHDDRYERAAHALQSGVAAKMDIDPSETTPKHLRVGVNAAHVSIAALAKVLIDKGIITLQEYVDANAEQMEVERDAYAAWLSERLGTNITLA